MKLNQFEYFKEISSSNLNLIENQSKLLKFKIGQPISSKSEISSKVLIILKGQARLIGTENNSYTTIAKLSPGSIIGLCSLLRAGPCEEVTASTEVTGLSIPDEVMIKLYSEEETFRQFCDNNLFPAELLSISEHLNEKSIKSDIKLIQVFNSLLKTSILKAVDSESSLKKEDEFIFLTASYNVSEKKFGERLEDLHKVHIRPPFKGRFIGIHRNLLNQIDNSPNKQIKPILDEEFKTEDAPLTPRKSSAKIGQYSRDINHEVIRASGDIRETIACLQMIANDLNLPFRKDNIEKILRDELRRGKKPSLEICASLLSSLGVYVSGLKIKSKYGNRIQISSFVSYKNNFCIVKDSNDKGLLIASPSEGLINIKTSEIEEYFGDSIEFLVVEKHSHTPEKKFGLNWFLPSITKYKGTLSQVLIASFVVQLFGLANPLLIQVIIDKVISQRSLDTLQVLGIAMVFVTILGGFIGGLRTFLFAETTNRIDTRLGSEVIDHLLRLPLKYFDKRPVGELGSRVAELEKIRNFLTGQALTTILDAAFSIIYIVVMFFYSSLLTFVALAVVPIQILLTLIGSPLLRRQIRETALKNANTQSHLVEVLTGIQTVKAQNIETVSRWKWQDLYSKYISRTFEKTITGTALSQTSQVLQQLSQLLVLWIGADLVLSGNISLGQLIAFRIISSYVTQPLLRLSSIWQSVQELKVSFERLADIIDTPQESIKTDKSNISLPEIKGKVSFQNLSFSFSQDKRDVLKNINLEISQGKFVGIVGQSGSGKSTLMKLLPRLYDLERGKILIDDYDINKVELYSLRRQIGIVPQDPLLFSGSVSENISITNTKLDTDEIIEAAKIADAHDFIMNLPLGYSTSVGERGSSLSGGQRQRIAIARTIISKPRMLILDEATSALDYETEANVCNNLKKSCNGSTVFFITHRLSTIKNADIVIMMHQGSIAEVGTHNDLMERKGRYYALYKQQESS